MFGVDGLSWGAGYGEVESGEASKYWYESGDDEHFTGFINIRYGSNDYWLPRSSY